MSEKRKASTKLKSESTPKKKVYRIHARKSISKGIEPSEQPEETLSGRVLDAQSSLPTMDVSHPSTQKLQSIARSGVLAASLHRSKTKWLTEGIFERYWTKPTKKKGMQELDKNPARDSMQKLGSCKMIIEPHVFEAILFGIKDSSNHNAFNSTPIPNPHNVFQQAPVSNSPLQSLSNITTSSTTTSTPSIPHSSHPLSNAMPTTSSPLPTNLMKVSNQPQQITQTERQPNNMIPANIPGSDQQPAAKQRQDPVISMLAQRASSNSDLKVLMKIVASGSATPQQLKEFQSHIDDLTAMSQRQQPNSLAQPPTPATSLHASVASSGSISQPQAGVFKGTYVSQITATPKPKPYVQMKHDFSGIAVDFAGGSGDRFLFPKYSILEFSQSRTQMTASFLIVRYGKHGTATDISKRYYQPITVRLIAKDPKVLEALFRAVAPLEEVKGHMHKAMAETIRADTVNLALQIPAIHDETENNGDSTPSYTGPSALDRRASLKISAMRASPASVSEGRGRGGRHRQDDTENLCRCCFTTVSGAQNRDEDGLVSCSACRILQASTAPRILRTGRGSAMTGLATAQQSLVLS